MTATIPPDVAAYLEQAAMQMAEDSGFSPESESSMSAWINSNFNSICELAMSMMQNFAAKILCDERIRDAAAEHGAKLVYERIPKTTEKKWNPRFVAYAASRGLEPDAAVRADGGSMVNYLTWRP